MCLTIFRQCRYPLVRKYKRPLNIEGKTDNAAMESERLPLKEWNRYKMFQHMQELQVIQRAFRLQAKAIEELKYIRPELSTAALQVFVL